MNSSNSSFFSWGHADFKNIGLIGRQLQVIKNEYFLYVRSLAFDQKSLLAVYFVFPNFLKDVPDFKSFEK